LGNKETIISLFAEHVKDRIEGKKRRYVYQSVSL